MIEIGQEPSNLIRFDQRFETKLVVKQFLLTVSLPSYLFLLNTYRCVQSVALWVIENVRFDVKTQDAVCRGQ